MECYKYKVTKQVLIVPALCYLPGFVHCHRVEWCLTNTSCLLIYSFYWCLSSISTWALVAESVIMSLLCCIDGQIIISTHQGRKVHQNCIPDDNDIKAFLFFWHSQCVPPAVTKVSTSYSSFLCLGHKQVKDVWWILSGLKNIVFVERHSNILLIMMYLWWRILIIVFYEIYYLT